MRERSKQIALFTLIFISGAMLALGVSYIANRKIFERNFSLERMHVSDLQLIQKQEQTLSSMKSKVEDTNKVIKYRSSDINYSHLIEYDQKSNRYTVQTIDNKTSQPVDGKTQLSFQRLLNMISFDLGLIPDDIILATQNNRYYALLKKAQGGLTQVYSLSTDQYGANIKMQVLFSDWLSSKVSYMCGYQINAYYPQVKSIARTYGCADGGGGGGTLQLVTESGSVKKLIRYGGGASTSDSENGAMLPRFLGYVSGRFYFGELAEKKLASEDAWITKIFSIDPLTAQKEHLQIDLPENTYDESYKDSPAIGMNELALRRIGQQGDSTAKDYFLNVKTLQIREQ